ncbi:MAG: Do family serine endopeptidase [Kiloniellales bacterium]
MRAALSCFCAHRIAAAALLLAVALAPAAVRAEQQVPASREQISLSFAPVVRQAAPAVVNIYTKRVVQQRGISPLFNDPLFKRFFGEDFGFFGMPRERVQNSLGSGVIVSGDGLIVTNYHVIKGASEIRVVLADRRELEAEMVLEDERTDLSVLRIDPKGETLPFLEFRDSDSIEVGDLVLAIGNPFGVGQTVTSGIVSALARTQAGISDYSFFIQTDAAINPGNSGGALVTLDGKLLGINTAIYSRGGGSIGIGFAIPSNMVRTVVASAMHGGRVMRPWPGLLGQTLTADLAEGFGLERPGGVVVSKIYPGGPADVAGLQRGDAVVAVDGQPVDDLQAFRFRIATRELGTTVDLDVRRDHEAITLALPMARAPETPVRDETLLEGRHPLAGATVANLSPALADELDMEGAWEGVVITDVSRGSPAYRLGFRPRDVMLAVNRVECETVQALRRELERPGEHWAVTFSREGRARTVEISG